MYVGNIESRLRVLLLRNRIRRRCIVAAASLALGACALGPQYERPKIAAPSAWRRAQTNAPVPWPSADWWRGFGSTRLDFLIDRAQRGNDDIAAAIARVREANAQSRIVGAALLPAVAATADATRARSQTGGSSLRSYSEYTPKISASYELDFWGRNRASLDAAEALAAGSRYARATIELTVLTGVASTYFQALELRERLRIARSNLADAQTILTGLRLEQTAGTANALDVAQQETAVATLYAAIPPLEHQLSQSVDALAILIGSAPETLDLGGETLSVLSRPSVQPGLPSELLARRPDVAEAEAQLIAAARQGAQELERLFEQDSSTSK